MKKLLLPFLLLCFVLLSPVASNAQIQEGIETVKEIKSLFPKKNKETKKEEPKKEEQEEKAEESAATPQDKPAQPAKPSFASYSKYDFIPGEKVFFYEDFSQDNIGDFPAIWNTNKSGEIVTTNVAPGNWFKLGADGMYVLEKGLPMPENFTMEYDVIPTVKEGTDGPAAYDMTLLMTNQEGFFPQMYVPGEGGIALWFDVTNRHSFNTYYQGSYVISGDYSEGKGFLKVNEVNHIAIWVQKSRFRLYMHGEKIFDLPKAFDASLVLNQIRFLTQAGSEPMITNIRFADAGADMRSKLLTEGKLVTHGIYFDSGSDKIKPESYGTLKSIAKVLTDNPTVKVKIVGHTDSDGNDANNLDLSKRRGAAVKASLTKDFSIDAARMESDGKGKTEPISPNTTPEGKANNRRVEFLKL